MPAGMPMAAACGCSYRIRAHTERRARGSSGSRRPAGQPRTSTRVCRSRSRFRVAIARFASSGLRRTTGSSRSGRCQVTTRTASRRRSSILPAGVSAITRAISAASRSRASGTGLRRRAPRRYGLIATSQRRPSLDAAPTPWAGKQFVPRARRLSAQRTVTSEQRAEATSKQPSFLLGHPSRAASAEPNSAPHGAGYAPERRSVRRVGRKVISEKVAVQPSPVGD